MVYNSLENNTESLVSIIIPMYNGEKVIEHCLISLINQSYINIEIIVIDDGSSDNSKSICEKFIKQDPRIKLITKKNGGVSSARNCGLKYIKGKFVTFVDCDDIVNIKFIEMLVNNILLHNSDICISSFNRITSNFCYNNFESIINEKVDQKNLVSITLTPSEVLQKMIIEDSFKWEVCGKLFKSQIVENLFFDESEVLFEDFTYTCKTLVYCSNIVYIPLKLYNYVDNPLSASKQMYNEKLIHLIETSHNFDIYIQQNFPYLIHCSIYFKAVIYFDILDKIICSNSSFIDCYNSYSSNRNNVKKYFDLLYDLRKKIFELNMIPKRIKIKYLFTINRFFYYISRFFFYRLKSISAKSYIK